MRYGNKIGTPDCSGLMMMLGSIVGYMVSGVQNISTRIGHGP